MHHERCERRYAGIRYGLRGFYSSERKPITLSRQFVSDIHLKGGTILGTSRGGADMKEIVHRIKLWGLNMVFVIGGNGVSWLHLILRSCTCMFVHCLWSGVLESSWPVQLDSVSIMCAQVGMRLQMPYTKNAEEMT
jgi:6-phosphofructokinase 1